MAGYHIQRFVQAQEAWNARKHSLKHSILFAIACSEHLLNLLKMLW